MCFQMGSEKWQCLDHPNRVGQLIPQSCHCHRETAVTVPDGLAQRIVRQMRTSTLDVGGAGPVAQQDTPVLGHASRSTLLSAVCRSAGHVLETNAALSKEE